MKRPNVLNLTCPAIPVVRIGFVGLGNRGILALERYMHLEGIEVKALCDLRKENIERAERILQESGRPKAENYSEEGMWRRMCECKEIDLVYICTDWLTHTEIAVYALQQGRHVALEVPAAIRRCAARRDSCRNIPFPVLCWINTEKSLCPASSLSE